MRSYELRLRQNDALFNSMTVMRCTLRCRSLDTWWVVSGKLQKSSKLQKAAEHSDASSLLHERYALVERLSAGQKSAVYCAQDRERHCLVAIKQFDCRDHAALHQFRTEVKLLSQLQHPCLPALFDALIENNVGYLVTSFVPGEDLAYQLARRAHPFPIERVFEWAEQLLDLLAYLHSQTPPVIHCDIKPHNLKLKADGQLVLLDLGIARRAGEESIGHTPAYCAPEQLSGAALTPRCDLYALSATLYDLLTGIKPADAHTRLTAVRESGIDPLLPASLWNPALSSALDGVLAHGLRLDPALRFADASEMRAALREGMQAPSVQLHNTSAPIGREVLLGEVRRILMQPEVRLLTLVGAAGVGKSCVARAASAQMHPFFPGGIAIVELGEVSEEQAAVDAIQQATNSLNAQGPALLVLDNVDPVASVVAQLLASGLLAAQSHITFLATSRAVLRLPVENVLTVPPLPIPGPDTIHDLSVVQSSPAVQLFVACLQVVQPDFHLNEENAEAIARLCVVLDGLPLALEWAARQMPYATPAQIIERFDETLHTILSADVTLAMRSASPAGALAWSYANLTAEEQCLFAQLAVFVDGCTAAAACAVLSLNDLADADPTKQMDIEKVLRSLVDQSLLQLHPRNEAMRYEMLSTVRTFALKHLRMSGRAEEIARRHAHYFVQWVEEGNTLAAPDEMRIARLRAEEGNLLAALAWLHAQKETMMALRLCVALWRFWEVRGAYRTGLAWLEQVLALPGHCSSPGNETEEEHARLRARVLMGAAALARNLSQYAAAHRYFAAALEIYRTLQDETGAATALNGLGTVAFYQEETDVAIYYFSEALTLHRSLGNSRGIAAALNNLATLAEGRSDYLHAKHLHEEALALFRSMNDTVNEAYTLGNLGVVAEHTGDFQQAVMYYRASLDMHEMLGEMWGMAAMLTNLGSTLDRLHEHTEAHILLHEGLQLFDELGEQAGVIQALHALACNAFYRNLPDDALCFLAASEHLETKIQYRLPDVDRLERQQLYAKLLAAMGEAEFNRRWALALEVIPLLQLKALIQTPC
ncbi:tetratricopeptide repeat protein [Caldilinea sp.]|jgi:predicted ATPase/Tfp pilus assembly protein PilF|uniref:protein kinase domain-containing protein n=1 Tax=Caldilinea sp. TaxID=2293560 RepID=UPI001B2B23AD|nr:tetratricopeptide repeat protein [Caldilinea sp.]